MVQLAANLSSFGFLQPILAKIWDLDSNVRLNAAFQLFSELPLSNDNEVEVPVVSETILDDPEAVLSQNHDLSVVYTIRRLVRGLTSPRDHARLGFAVTLTQVPIVSHRLLLGDGVTFRAAPTDATSCRL